MHFRDSQQRKVSCVHDRSSQTFREKSRNRYANEKKEKEHELQDNENDIMKVMNDHYEFLRSSRDHGSYVVKFQNPESHRIKNFRFEFEDNYEKLKTLWEE
jgi:hypothetical protein